jgi:hypothetical protein
MVDGTCDKQTIVQCYVEKGTQTVCLRTSISVYKGMKSSVNGTKFFGSRWSHYRMLRTVFGFKKGEVT